jgi:hypothetical protein
VEKKNSKKLKKNNYTIFIKFEFTGIGYVVIVGINENKKYNKNITDYDSW